MDKLLQRRLLVAACAECGEEFGKTRYVPEFCWRSPWRSSGESRGVRDLVAVEAQREVRLQLETGFPDGFEVKDKAGKDGIS